MARVNGQAGQGFEHFFQPGADRCELLWCVLDLCILESFDLHKNFLRLGPCLSEGIGAFSKICFSSGLLNNIDLWCFLNVSLIFGSRGLKSNGAISLLGSWSKLLSFFFRASLLFSSKLFPAICFNLLNCASIILGLKNRF